MSASRCVMPARLESTGERACPMNACICSSAAGEPPASCSTTTTTTTISAGLFNRVPVVAGEDGGSCLFRPLEAVQPLLAASNWQDDALSASPLRGVVILSVRGRRTVGRPPEGLKRQHPPPSPAAKTRLSRLPRRVRLVRRPQRPSHSQQSFLVPM